MGHFFLAAAATSTELWQSMPHSGSSARSGEGRTPELVPTARTGICVTYPTLGAQRSTYRLVAFVDSLQRMIKSGRSGCVTADTLQRTHSNDTTGRPTDAQ